VIKAMQQKLKLSPHWNIKQIGKSLTLSGGADIVYDVELENDGTSFFSSLKSNQTFTRNDLGLDDQRVLEELITAEVVVPILQRNKELKIAITGDKNHLRLGAQKQVTATDLVVVVRTNSTYAELLEKINYLDLLQPHLLVDMAFHHTLSIGPLVFPGETACIACLQGRIGIRWGDEKPPVKSRVADKYSGIVAELVKAELDRIKDGDTGLTNKTISWNFQDRAVKTSQLLKVPLCPICTKNKIDHSGALALPWGKHESTSNTV
jgi:bacteriocin biosynthesis cyclodehydratase domain-containing protein